MFSATNDSYKDKKGTWFMFEKLSLTFLSQDKVYPVRSSKNIPTAATPLEKTNQFVVDWKDSKVFLLG